MKGAKLFGIIVSLVFAFTTASTVGAYDGSIGGGDWKDADTFYLGNVVKVDAKKRVLTLKTKFEKTPKTYTLHLQPECYVMTAHRGIFSKFADLKPGTLVSVYGWPKHGKWWARRIDTWNPKNYLIKRLASDRKAGVYWKHEQFN